MAADYLHKHPQFPDLIRIVAEEKGIAPALVEKDYWIFRGGDERDLTKNQAFHLRDPETRAAYEKAYNATSALYYADKPRLDEILAEIGKWADRL